MSKVGDFFCTALTIIGGLAGIGMFVTAIVVCSSIIICILGKGC